MTFPSLLMRLFANHKPEVLADKVASRSREAIWDRVSHRMNELAGAEARGYVRAHGAAIIEREASRLIAEEEPKAARHRDQIIHSATESAIRLVLEQAYLGIRKAQPKRRAA